MRAVVQRVSWATVCWCEEGEERSEHIGRGLLILVGAGAGDAPEDADRLADKVAVLRVFPDARGRFDQSLQEIGGEALVVSQFTLYADCRRGRRPSFIEAAEPTAGRRLCERFGERLRSHGLTTRTGSFGARMAVSLENDGPVTVVLSTDPWETRIGARAGLDSARR
jgi:D-tyrosyl-tRNA(Tyr) deacylase